MAPRITAILSTHRATGLEKALVHKGVASTTALSASSSSPMCAAANALAASVVNVTSGAGEVIAAMRRISLRWSAVFASASMPWTRLSVPESTPL